MYIYTNINVRIYDYSFKYICVARYLKLRSSCLTCSAMSSLNPVGFTTTRQLSEILIPKI